MSLEHDAIGFRDSSSVKLATKRHNETQIVREELSSFLCLVVPFRGYRAVDYLRFRFIGIVGGDAEAEAAETVVGDGPME